MTGAAALAGLAITAPGVVAQEDAAEEANDTIIVTGSRVRRTGFETLQPATVLTNETLELRGSINVADTLNEMPGFSIPGSSPVGAQGGTNGQNFVDFLGLGAQRTLTLVNGQRFPAGNTGGLSVDLNSIPSVLIDRVETIAIGGAPIYGADAIAGTVNIILRDDYEGADFVTSYGWSPEYNDAARFRAAGSWGRFFDNGRGNFVIAAEMSEVEGLGQRDRPATDAGLRFEQPEDPTSPYSQVLISDPTVAVDSVNGGPLFFGNRFGFNIFGNGIPLDPTDPASPLSQFDAGGNLVPFVPGGGTGSVIFKSGGDGLDLNEFTALYTDLTRYNANLFINYDVSDRVTFHAEGWFARSEATELYNQPSYNSPAFGGTPGNNWGNVGEGPVPILLSNPFLPTATRDTIQIALNQRHDFNGDGLADPTIDTDGDGVPDQVGFWRFGSLRGIYGDSPARSERNTYRAVLGLDGDIDLGGRNYEWDVYYTYGQTDSRDTQLEIITPNFEQAIQVVADASGNPVCLDPSNGCVPLNVVGTPTPEAAAWVSATTENRTTIEQHVFTANIAGDLFSLPAGEVGAAAGLSYRQELADYAPNALGAAGLTRVPQTPLKGDFSSTEVYAEAVVPLLGGALDTPLVEVLEFEGAIRYVDNSNAGADTTWTAGLRYVPHPTLELRGNVTQSIRGPSITELFTPVSQTFLFANDPCDARFVGEGNNPSVRAANCAAAGIAQPFTSFIVNASQPGTISGNPNLTSEKADSWTVGFIARPSFLDGLTMSVDWLEIDLTDAIESLGATEIMEACYDSPNFPAESFCNLITRNASGQVTGISTGYQNVGQVEFSGLLSTVNYAMDLGEYGTLNLNANYTYTDNHTITTGGGNPNRNDGEIGESKHRATVSATWMNGRWTVFNQVRWLSDAVFDNLDDATSKDILGVDDWYVFDTSVAYELNDSTSIQFNVDNLFNEAPPYPAVASGAGITTYFPGILERYTTVTLRTRF